MLIRCKEGQERIHDENKAMGFGIMVDQRRGVAPLARRARTKGNKRAASKIPAREQWHALVNDARLYAAGIEIGARVQVRPKGPPKMRIAFRAGKVEATVDCVHVAVYAGPLASMPAESQLARSSEDHPVELAPEEHFFALNSYVAGIAEVGLGAMFAIAREARHLSVGFNTLMQQQILRALFEVAPVTAMEFCLWVKEDAGRNMVLANVDEIIVEYLEQEHDLPKEFLVHLAGDRNQVVRIAVATRKDTPPEILMRLARDSHLRVRCRVARNRFAPREALERLVRDTEWQVRSALALNKGIPDAIRRRLADDWVEDVRQKAINEDGSRIISERNGTRWYRDRDGFEWSEETEDSTYDEDHEHKYELTAEDLADAPLMPESPPALEDGGQDEDVEGNGEGGQAKAPGHKRQKKGRSKRGG